jgi:hypothetical protein
MQQGVSIQGHHLRLVCLGHGGKAYIYCWGNAICGCRTSSITGITSVLFLAKLKRSRSELWEKTRPPGYGAIDAAGGGAPGPRLPECCCQLGSRLVFSSAISFSPLTGSPGTRFSVTFLQKMKSPAGDRHLLGFLFFLLRHHPFVLLRLGPQSSALALACAAYVTKAPCAAGTARPQRTEAWLPGRAPCGLGLPHLERSAGPGDALRGSKTFLEKMYSEVLRSFWSRL